MKTHQARLHVRNINTRDPMIGDTGLRWSDIRTIKRLAVDAIERLEAGECRCRTAPRDWPAAMRKYNTILAKERRLLP